MAEIVAQPQTTGQTTGIINTIFHILANYWWLFLILGLLIGALVLAYVIWQAKQENDRRRDSSVYATAMNIREGCTTNATPEWIINKYSYWNLLWLGIPFKMNEHSVRIVDIDRNIIGFYRGHTTTQDGDIVYLLYKTKFLLGLIEDKFLLYCPKNIRLPEIDKKGMPLLTPEGKQILEYKKLPADLITEDVKMGNEIRIKCKTIMKHGNYYYFPSYIIILPNGEQQHINMINDIAHYVAKTNYIMQLETGYSDMSRAMGKAAEINSELRFRQKSPEREKSIDDENPIE
jgi:hypothetical protein